MIPILLALGASFQTARGAQHGVVETRVQRAALFKNGLAFVTRAGVLAQPAGAVRLEDLPPPVHGTFWLFADPARATLGCAVARRVEIAESVPALSIADVLRANVGNEVTLLVGEKDMVQGTLLAVPEAPLFVEPDPWQRNPYESYLPQPQANLVLLRTASGTMALQVADVRRVEAKTLSVTTTRRRPGTSLTFAFESKDEASVPFAVQYLVRGLTWAPSYAIDLADPQVATLTAKAEVLNESEELAGATLQFVTGFPNLQYGHVVDPIAMRGDLDSFLSALSQPAGSAGNHMVLTQAVMSNRARADEAIFPVAGAPAGGESAEDLFLYEQKDVTLERGERASYALFSVRVPYEHVHEWSIPSTIDEDDGRQESEAGLHQEEVWHSVRLANDSGVPWTTAPAMTMKGGTLLGQDTLTYCAAGARTTVRITRAVDVQAQAAEYEAERQRSAATFYGYSYDRVIVRGELKVTNRKREAVRLEIDKRIEGEVTNNPNQASVTALAKGLKRVNPTQKLIWSVPLEAGKAATIVYEYSLYVRG